MLKFQKAGVRFRDIAILAPYKAQVVLFRKQVTLISQKIPDIDQAHISTVDAFIGEERSIVMISLTVEKNLGFLRKADRLAVAFSHAMDSLLIFNDYSSIVQRRGYDAFNTMVEYYRSINAFRTYNTDNLRELT